jgi:hypothetical protein
MKRFMVEDMKSVELTFLFPGLPQVPSYAACSYPPTGFKTWSLKSRLSLLGLSTFQVTETTSFVTANHADLDPMLTT